MRALLLSIALFCVGVGAARAITPAAAGLASWYGEEHRGKLMANGRPFDPEKLTAASWFYRLGTEVCVTRATATGPVCSVLVTITDRGPAHELVRSGRIIDLSHAAFKRLAPPGSGLVAVTVQPVSKRCQAPPAEPTNGTTRKLAP